MRDSFRARGFTLIEIMVVIAIIGVMATLSVFALDKASRAARLSGARFDVMNAVGQARSKAISSGKDVYVIFSNLDSTTFWPQTAAPKVIIYKDDGLNMRSSLGAIMGEVNANLANIVDQVSAASGLAWSSGLAFRDNQATVVGSCDLTRLPVYIQVTGARRTQRNCANTWCTFCEVQAGECVGAVRFSSDGSARIVTGPAGLRGGMVKLVNPFGHPSETASTNFGMCIVISEPNGQVVSL